MGVLNRGKARELEIECVTGWLSVLSSESLSVPIAPTLARLDDQ